MTDEIPAFQQHQRYPLSRPRLLDVQPLLNGDTETSGPLHRTELGALFAGDCLSILPQFKSEIIDTVFADPPFNLGKTYGEHTDDCRPDLDYIEWCKRWLVECIRVLKPGGALFLYNLPKWNMQLGAFLASSEMEFRHWIAVETSTCFPIVGRLYPSHYSLLYFTKGKPATFPVSELPFAPVAIAAAR